MKDIKKFILESNKTNIISESRRDEIEKILSQKECPIADEEFYEKYDLYSYAVAPNLDGFVDEFEIDYMGDFWVLSEQLNADIPCDELPLEILPYSYGYNQESLEDFDYYDNIWKNAKKTEKSKTIRMIKKAIREYN